MNNDKIIIDLVAKLNHGEATFAFTKKNGEVRAARGTRNMGVALKVAERTGKTISVDDITPKGTGLQGPAWQIKYFDLDKWGWRSFDSNRLITANT